MKLILCICIIYEFILEMENVMRSAKKILTGLFAAGIFFMNSYTAFAEEYDSIVDRHKVPEEIYTWVQSTDRANYYFNHEQMGYYVSEDGFIDLDTLIVPTLCTYDEIQIQDVVSKRRWNMQKLTGYDKLVGRADYLMFKLTEGTVQVTERNDLDDKWGTLDTDTSGQPIYLSDLNKNSVECKFYRSILRYAKKHNEQIIKRSWGKLSAEDKKLPEEKMPLMKIDLP